MIMIVFFRLTGLIVALLLVAGIAGSTSAAAVEPLVQSPTTLPDLVVEQIFVNPPSPKAGEKADISVVVKNAGAAAAPGFSLHLYVDPVDDPPTTSTPTTTQFIYSIPLGPGEVFDGYTRGDHTFSRDDWRICAWVDRDNQVEEADEANNLRCISSPATPPGGGDDYEPDNRCAEAKEITTDGQAQIRNLYRESDQPDVDWVKFTAESGVKYTAHAIAVGEDADLALELHHACDGPPSFGASAKAVFTAPAGGVYSLKVTSSLPDYGPDNAYHLRVVADETCSDALEPNNLCQLPNELAVNAGPQSHSFCTEGDVDWMRFEVRAGGHYTVEASNVGSRSQARLNLYERCNAEAVASGEQLEFTARASGYFYLEAKHQNPASFGPGTEYTVQVTGAGGCVEDAMEPDNTPATAQPLSVDGNPRRHNICPAGDLDWVKFTAATSVTYTVETLNLTPEADTLLCLHDASGEPIRCDDDGGAGLGSRLVITDAQAGEYFFRIKDNDPEAAGARVQYDVQVITGLCKPDVHEPNNGIAAARPITPNGSPQHHTICPAGDEDWVSFEALANTTYVISTTAIGASADTELELYDEVGVLLARNDDHGPGIGSLLVYTPTRTGLSYVKVQHFNPQTYGAGTEYELSVRAGAVSPSTVDPQHPPQPPPPPPPAPETAVRTLILVNPTRLAELYNEAEASELMSKLAQLAGRNEVRGEIIRLDHNTGINAAYAGWIAEISSVDKANHVANEIRRLIMNYLAERSGVEYVLLVGDDRALPLRRVPDHTTLQPEHTYHDVDPTHPTGAALRANYFLTDDFYVARQPTPHQGRELYIPDLAVGRLIEAPADMIALIDVFLADPVTTVKHVLVTGYDFVQDTAHAECKDWRAVLGDESRAVCLIGSSWTKEQFQPLQFRPAPPFKVQSINGHATHYEQGAATGAGTSAGQVVAAPMDLSGGLVYSLGCHAGLNVPFSNSINPLDLPEAFVKKGANYVGNTGYGWGLLNSIGLSERLIRLFTGELHRGEQVAMGQALARAKTRYYEQSQTFSAFDEKVMQQLIFYGLPMYALRTNNPQPFDVEFPGVGFDFESPGVLGGDEVITRTVRVDFGRILNPNDPIGNLESFSTPSGQYLALYDSINAGVGEPVQPLHFGSIALPNTTARSAVLLSGVVTSTFEQFDPLIGTPVNEYVPRSDADEASLPAATGWYPPIPTAVRSHRGAANLITQLGQFHAGEHKLRLFSDLEVAIYYSTSPDQTPPRVLVVDGLYNPALHRVNIKAEVVDESGVKEVFASYIEDDRVAAAAIRSVKLTFDPTAQKWRGSFPGNANTVYFIQAVDNAGNVASATRKGNYYRPARARPAQGGRVYLPLVSR